MILPNWRGLKGQDFRVKWKLLPAVVQLQSLNPLYPQTIQNDAEKDFL